MSTSPLAGARSRSVLVVRPLRDGLVAAGPYAAPRLTLHERRAGAARLLARCAAEAIAADADLPVRVCLEHGPPAKVLLAYTAQAELLVLGGRRPASRLDHVPGAVIRA